MNYVKQFKINGVDTKQVACIELQGVPNAATEGCVGVLGMDMTSPTHEVYRCVAVNGSVYTWELLSAGMSIISSTITGEGGEFKEFPYSALRIPYNYIIKRGDLILDSEGYLYQINSIGSTSCIATYCGTHIGGIASGDKDYRLVVDNGKLQLVTESGAVISSIDHLVADNDTLTSDAKGRTSVRGIKTVTDTTLRLFVGTKVEYESLTDTQKSNLFAIITDDTTEDSILEAIENLELYIHRMENNYLHDNADAMVYEGDAANGVTIYRRQDKGQCFIASWYAEGTRCVCFGLVYWDSDDVTITPVTTILNGKRYGLRIETDGVIDETYISGNARVVQYSETGTQEDLSISNTGLKMRSLTSNRIGE